MKIDIVIPTYKLDLSIIELLNRLLHQTIPVQTIFLLNTEEKYWNPKIDEYINQNIHERQLHERQLNDGQLHERQLHDGQIDKECLTKINVPHDNLVNDSFSKAKSDNNEEKRSQMDDLPQKLIVLHHSLKEFDHCVTRDKGMHISDAALTR